jgi:uncharacterized protein (DUF924 family)
MHEAVVLKALRAIEFNSSFEAKFNQHFKNAANAACRGDAQEWFDRSVVHIMIYLAGLISQFFLICFSFDPT